jgi:methyl-accepting chemotaxis protein
MFGLRTYSLSLALKLCLGFAAVLVLALTVGIVGVLQIRSEADPTKTVYFKQVGGIDAIRDSNSLQFEAARFQYRAILAGNHKDFVEMRGETTDAADESIEAFSEFFEGLPQGRFRTQAAQFLALLKRMKAARTELLAVVAADPAGAARSAKVRGLAAGIEGDTDTADELADALVTADTDLADSSAGQAKADANRTLVIMLVLLAVAVLGSSAVAYLIVRSIRRPIGRLIAVSEGAAAGDLTVRADEGDDELGRLGRAFNAMVEGLAALAARIGAVSDHLAATSQQMSSSSEATGRAVGQIATAVATMATGADRQLTMVEDARSSVDDIVRAAEASAESARATAAAAGEARTVAAEGVEAANEATEAMRSVRESTGSVTAAINELATKSEQIGGIVETITTIAGQTNLLALNAAIEAARAGEQGRGFAVVAEEVRKLAEESQGAAASIASLVAEIQSETQLTVKAVTEGSERTDNGASVVERTREAFRLIGERVEDMTARIEDIAAAADQIATGTSRMREGMVEVASVAEQSSASTAEVSASTEHTSSSADEIAASAHDLARNAEELTALVRQFKVAP